MLDQETFKSHFEWEYLCWPTKKWFNPNQICAFGPDRAQNAVWHWRNASATSLVQSSLLWGCNGRRMCGPKSQILGGGASQKRLAREQTAEGERQDCPTPQHTEPLEEARRRGEIMTMSGLADYAANNPRRAEESPALVHRNIRLAPSVAFIRSLST